ncbi:hypothetical protein F0562_002452 [Nyssa sinensis]|uniref:WAT1-related protein n=1 Tax=Nyssa sinensis TaxID=561372 RepID=A0A5J5C614_9ASTE|nr:hypothetical protein F0562_002452 [Nyssa sinensis]
MTNTIAALTFTIAVILRREILDVRNARGIAKIIGTLVSLAGVMTMTLYKGPAARSLWSAPIHISKNNVHENWVKGPILTVASCISWSVWYIMQALTLKKYPAQLSLTAWVNFFGGAQSAAFTASIQHKPAAWFYSSNIELMSTIYAQEKGPFLLPCLAPFGTVMVAVAAYFFVGEKLYMGNLLGGVLALTGLYLLLWGKGNDQEVHIKSPEQSCSTHGKQKEFEIRQAGSAEEREVL